MEDLFKVKTSEQVIITINRSFIKQIDVTEGKTDKNKGKSKVKTVPVPVPVPVPLGGNQENITIITNTPSKPSKEEKINQAIQFTLKGNISEAIKYYQHLIYQGFKDHRIYSNYAIILKELGKSKEAELLLKKAIELNPNCYVSHLNLGVILNTIGKSEEAEKSTRKSIELNPNFAEAYLSLGNILNDLGKSKEAELSTREAIKLKPNYAKGYYNLGDILIEIGELKEAELSTRKAIKLKPNYAEAHLNLGVILNTIGKLEEAEKSTRKSIELNPNFVKANYNLSTILLQNKKFQEGWRKYEWRWKLDENKESKNKKFRTIKPEWSPGKRGRVLLWAEQGVGDEILYTSLIADFLNEVDQLIVQVDERLIPLLKRSFNEQIIYITRNQFLKMEKYDYQIAMGSLPKFLRANQESFERARKAFLKADERKTKIFLKQIKEKKFDKIVGISWSSKSNADKKKSISLEEFILGIYTPNICFVNLQYGDIKYEIKSIKKKYDIDIYDVENIDIFNNIDDLAALIDACDQIISIDNVTAVLAGAIGANCNLILGFKGHFYWGINDTKSYWLPSLKIFRQTNMHSWNEPLKEIKNEIKINNPRSYS